MTHRSLFPILSLLALIAAPLLAAPAHYLANGHVTAVQLLAPPPAPGSAEQMADLDTTYRVYSAASPEDHARGVDETKLSIFHFAPAIGPWFQPGKFRKTEALFQNVEADAKIVVDAGKKHWERLRPYHADPARFPNPIEQKPKSDYSYPSGHSTRGTIYALLLAELFPEKRDALLAIGREAGWLRVEGGVHYPTDIYAGRVLGQALAQEFLRSAAFQHDLAEARAEVSAADKAH
jgi:acid phosphatase (class A)